MANFVCKVCNKSYKHKSSYNRHVGHDGICKTIINNKCIHCDKTYYDKYNLDRHLKICPKKPIKLSEETINEIHKLQLSDIIKDKDTNNLTQEDILEINQATYEIVKQNIVKKKKDLIIHKLNFEIETINYIIHNLTTMDNFDEHELYKNVEYLNQVNYQIINLLSRKIHEEHYRNKLKDLKLENYDEEHNKNITLDSITNDTGNTNSNNTNTTNAHNANNSNNTTNTTNANNTNTTNANTNNTVIYNTINNNNNYPPIRINPFGYEDISFISKEKILEILKGPNSIEKILELVYSKPENINFNRPSDKRNIIRKLNPDMSISIYDKKDFADLLTHNSNDLIKRCFHKIYSNLNFENRFVLTNKI